MSALFDQAIYAVARLPRQRQDIIARRILDAIGADSGWPADTTGPCSEVVLDDLADQARANLARTARSPMRLADPIAGAPRHAGSYGRHRTG